MIPRSVAAGAAAVVVGMSSWLAVAVPVHAYDPPPPPPCGFRCSPSVTPVEEGFLAEVESQMAVLNSAESNPVPCTIEVEENGTVTQMTGYYRWRLPVNSEQTWDQVRGGTTTGTWYRYECFVPGYHTDYGDYLRVQEFEAVNPDTIAQVAIDQALAGVGQHTLRTSPDGQALVAIETWFWAEVDGETVVTRTAGVPGIAVTVTARPSNLRVEPGSGSPTLECDGLGVAWTPGAVSECTYLYQQAGEYTATSSVLWTGSYTVNDTGPFDVTTPVARTASLPISVAEAQAINTRT